MTAELVARIREAWQSATPPAEVCTPTYDDEGVGAYFQGRTWDGHEVAALRYHSVGLSFFSVAGFCYYLPAYMLAVLADTRAADMIFDSILFHLSPNQLAMQWADKYRAQIAGFTPAQRDAIAGYLEWCAAKDDGRDEIAATLAYLATGTVEPSSSPRLLQLAEVSRDQSLRLAYTTVTDDDLVALADLPALRELDLNGTAITDVGLAHVSVLRELERLDLSGCKAITAVGLAHVAKLGKLAELRLPNVDLDDAGLAALAPLHLVRLDVVNNRRLTAAGWAALDLEHLEQVGMFGVDAPDAMLERLGRANRVCEIAVQSLTDAGLAALAAARSLTKLEVGHAELVGSSALACLAALPSLRELKLGHIAPMRWPSGFPALEALTLLSSELGDVDLGQPPLLAKLGLFGGALAPQVLARLARLPRLRELTLWCGGITDAALLELSDCNALERLSVHAASITSLAVVAHLPQLARLRLDALPALDDTALLALTAAPNLRELELEAVPITDAGLAALAGCDQLRTIRIAGSRVTADAIAAFRSDHPNMSLIA